jgi:hypothetical protein
METQTEGNASGESISSGLKGKAKPNILGKARVHIKQAEEAGSYAGIEGVTLIPRLYY